MCLNVWKINEWYSKCIHTVIFGLHCNLLLLTVNLKCSLLSVCFNNGLLLLFTFFLPSFILLLFSLNFAFLPRSGELLTQKLKSHLVRTQSLDVLPFKPGVGQYIAIHATLTAREFFLAYFYPSSPFTCIFSKTSPNFFLCWPAE